MQSDSGQARFCFPRALRITSGRDFEAALKTGRRHKCPHFQVFALFRSGTAFPRLGLIVGRRCGGAVERNLIKRRLREFFRLNRYRVRTDAEIVVRALPGASQLAFAAAAAEISEAFERLCVWM